MRHQLNEVSLMSVVWTTLLSGWYPPAAVDEEEGKGREGNDNRNPNFLKAFVRLTHQHCQHAQKLFVALDYSQLSKTKE